MSDYGIIGLLLSLILSIISGITLLGNRTSRGAIWLLETMLASLSCLLIPILILGYAGHLHASGLYLIQFSLAVVSVICRRRKLLELAKSTQEQLRFFARRFFSALRPKWA